jgi:hypothetical protein
MSRNPINILYIILLVFLASCKPAIKPGDLYGKWNYIKVEHPDANPPDSLRKAELDYNKPSIQFTNNKQVIMIWGGKVLSHGTFTTDGQSIKIKEELPDGTKREFPFWVMSLTEKQIVFETTNGADKSRVTAVKE